MTRTPDEILNLLEQAERDANGLPPVQRWNPPLLGDLDMRIARDGSWHYQGTPIQRPALAKLFSSILLHEGDDYFLVTPVEKWRITVEDLPFVATLVERVDEDGEPQLVFTTNIGTVVAAGEQHPVVVTRDAHGLPSPALLVRANLQARIGRNAFYQLVEWAREEQGQLVIDSGGITFSLGSVSP